MITVIGMHDPHMLPASLQRRIMECDLLAGGARHLAAFPQAGRERVVIDAQIDALLDRLEAAYAAGKEIVVLASGDPLWYGIGTTLRRRFEPEDMHIIPAPSAAQLAFAALAEPWHDAVLLSAHGRPLEPVIEQLVREPRRAAILTDEHNTPDRIAARLLDAGFFPCPAAVCERLGEEAQRIVRAPLVEIAAERFDPLNVLVLLPDPAPIGADRPFGLEDDELEHDGLITHLEVRAVALALLRLHPSSVVWDIGAGSGSVALEAARIAWHGQVYAVERDEQRMVRLRRNVERWGNARIHLTHGEAPAVCASWPDPDAVFIGGSGGQMDELIAFCAERLQANGRIVINLVTLELLGAALAALHAHGLQAAVQQIAMSRSRPLRGQTYLAALNPVYVVSAQKLQGMETNS